MTTALFKMSEGQRQMGDKVLAGKEKKRESPDSRKIKKTFQIDFKLSCGFLNFLLSAKRETPLFYVWLFSNGRGFMQISTL